MNEGLGHTCHGLTDYCYYYKVAIGTNIRYANLSLTFPVKKKMKTCLNHYLLLLILRYLRVWVWFGFQSQLHFSLHMRLDTLIYLRKTLMTTYNWFCSTKSETGTFFGSKVNQIKIAFSSTNKSKYLILFVEINFELHLHVIRLFGGGFWKIVVQEVVPKTVTKILENKV